MVYVRYLCVFIVYLDTFFLVLAMAKTKLVRALRLCHTAGPLQICK